MSTKIKKKIKKTTKITLRTLLGRLKNCDLIVAKGLGPDEQRYWRDGLVTEIDDWMFEVTDTELNLIQESCGIFSVTTFNLDQPVKKGKSVRVATIFPDLHPVTLQFITLTNLIK